MAQAKAAKSTSPLVDSYVKVLFSTGEYRYGFIQETAEDEAHLVVCMHDEGESKVAFDREEAETAGEVPFTTAFLPPAEQRLLPYLAQGMSTREIHGVTGQSPSTIRSHTRLLRARFGLETRQQLMVYAQGLVAKNA